MTRIVPCPTCNGAGEVTELVPIEGRASRIRFVSLCDTCGGDGLLDPSDAASIPNRRENAEGE